MAGKLSPETRADLLDAGWMLTTIAVWFLAGLTVWGLLTVIYAVLNRLAGWIAG